VGARPALAGHVHVADPEPPAAPCWKLSADPQFIDKVRDVVGLYLAPPQNALVLCVDEKSQIQALDRTAPILPILPTTPARMTHDYVRNGTTSLFTAFDLASGWVIAQPYRRRGRHRLGQLHTLGLQSQPCCPLHLKTDGRTGPTRATYGPHATNSPGYQRSLTGTQPLLASRNITPGRRRLVPPIFQAGYAGSIPFARAKCLI
jgi:hypothetical protein